MTEHNNTPKEKRLRNMDKWRYTLWTTLIYLIISHPVTYSLTNRHIGPLIGTPLSCATGPTAAGIVVHAIVFAVVLRFMMDMKL